MEANSRQELNRQGSMLLQKAFEVFNCAKVFKTDVLSVELFMSRKVNESVTFYYKINNQGLPESTEEPDTQQRDENGRFVSQEAQKGRSGLKFNSDYQRDDSDSDKGWSWDLRRLFSDAMQNSAMMGYDDLKTRVMKLGNIIRSSYSSNFNWLVALTTSFLSAFSLVFRYFQ